MRIAAESGCALHTVDRYGDGRPVRPVSAQRIAAAIAKLYQPGQVMDLSDDAIDLVASAEADR